MVQSFSKNKLTEEQEVFISQLADIKVYESRLLDCQSWQIYYNDLSVAAEKIRKLMKK